MTDPTAIRDAVLATPGVIAMHPGPFGTAATFTAQGRIWGVRLGADRVDVHLVGQVGRRLDALGAAVQAAVRGVSPGYPGAVVVHVEDITVPQPTARPGPAADPPPAIVQSPEEPRRTL